MDATSEQRKGGPIYRLPPLWLGPQIYVAKDIQQIVDWGLKAENVPEAQKLTRGAGIKVGIADTGRPTHPDVISRVKGSQNFTNSHTDEDLQGHGTHVAGILAASGAILGVAPEADLYMAKVLSDDGSGQSEWVAAGFEWLIEQGVDVLSASLGGAFDPAIAAVVTKAIGKGIFCIFAAGNDGASFVDDVGYPARLPHAVAVASYDANGKLSQFSSRGPEVTAAFPGDNILSTWLGGAYRRLSGTSMATPMCAGVVALMLSHYRKQLADGLKPAREMTGNDALISWIKETATDQGPHGHDDGWGWGIPSALALVDIPTAAAEKALALPPGANALRLCGRMSLQYPVVIGGQVGAFLYEERD